MRDFLSSEEIWINLFVTAAAVVLAFILHFFIFRIIRRSRMLKNREKLETVCRQLYSPSRILLVLLFIFIVYPSLDALSVYVSSTVRHILSIVLIITIAWLAIKSVRAGKLILLRKYDLSVKDNFKARKAYTQFSMLENIVIFLIVLVAMGITLMTFEAVREIGVSLLTSAGIAGIILGFAAQKLIATILAGIQIAITQPIRIDDVVIVEGEWGVIEEINLTYIVVRIWDQRRLVVPTTYFIEKPFQNWTRKTSQILGTVFIYTDYHVPFNKLRKELTRLLEGTDLWDKRVNVLQVTSAKETTVEIRALVSAADSSTAWELRVYIREKLIEFLRRRYPESLPRTRISIEDEVREQRKGEQITGRADMAGNQ